MEDLFQAEMAKALADTIEATNQVPMSMYDGEHAFMMMMSCVSMVPGGYRLHIKGMEHGTLMQALSFIRDVFPQQKGYHVKMSRASKELQAIGLGHMTRYITSHKDGTYTLDIRPITYEQVTFICRALFSW